MEERRQLKKKALDSKSPSLKERALAQYREKGKQVKTSARREKRQYVEILATETEAAIELHHSTTSQETTWRQRT